MSQKKQKGFRVLNIGAEWDIENALEWFFVKPNVDILCVVNLDVEQLGIKAKEWCDYCMANYADNKWG